MRRGCASCRVGSIKWTSGFIGRRATATMRFRWPRARWGCAGDCALLEGARMSGACLREKGPTEMHFELRAEREPAQAGGDGPRLLRAGGEAARPGGGPPGTFPEAT